jgi:hypothetical protein
MSDDVKDGPQVEPPAEERIDEHLRRVAPEFRRPAPDGGLADLRALRHQQTRTRVAGATGIVVLLLIGGITFAVTHRRSSGPSTPAGPTSTSAVATTGSVATTAGAAATPAASPPIQDTGPVALAAGAPGTAQATDAADEQTAVAALIDDKVLGVEWNGFGISKGVPPPGPTLPACASAPAWHPTAEAATVSDHQSHSHFTHQVDFFPSAAAASAQMDWNATAAGRACLVAILQAGYSAGTVSTTVSTWTGPRFDRHGDRLVSYGITVQQNDSGVALEAENQSVVWIQIGRTVTLLMLPADRPDGREDPGTAARLVALAADRLTAALKTNA